MSGVTFSGRSRSRFSRRTAWNRSPSELEEEFVVASTDGPLLDLTVSNPTACGLGLSASDLLNPLSSIGSLCYSPDPKGLLSARESVTDYYARHGATVAPEHLVLTASTSEAYSYLFRLLCEPKEEILIAQPSYPLFDYLADLSDISLRHYPLFYDHGWWIDTAELEGAITPRTRAIVLVHPNNPTGHLTSSGERDFLFDLCRRYDLTLIVDEVFLDYPHERLADVQSFAQSDSPPLTFVLSGLSKILALPQAKISWILALGPEKEKAEALARLDIIADTFLSVSTLSQLACPIWLQKAPEVQTGYSNGSL